MTKKFSFVIIGTLFFICLFSRPQDVLGYIGYTTDNNIILEDTHFYIDGKIVYRGHLQTNFMHSPYDTFTINLNIGIHKLEVWLPNENIRQSKRFFYWGYKYMVVDFFPKKRWSSTSNIFWINACNEYPLE